MIEVVLGETQPAQVVPSLDFSLMLSMLLDFRFNLLNKVLWDCEIHFDFLVVSCSFVV